jgi:hypothetical protein
MRNLRDLQTAGGLLSQGIPYNINGENMRKTILKYSVIMMIVAVKMSAAIASPATDGQSGYGVAQSDTNCPNCCITTKR